MKHHQDRLADIHFDESLEPSLTRLLDLIRESPFVLRPVKNSDPAAESLSSSKGFQLYPTVLKTTLFHDPVSDCFLKILHPLTLRERLDCLITDRARRLHALSEWLRHRGVRLPRVRAFGTIREGRKPFFAIDRVPGRSLYDILIREHRELPSELYRKVVDAVAGLHGLGYWLGDAHLSHVFVLDGEISGFVDIDSIGRNRPFRLENLARDLAGLNHPGLSLGRSDRESLLRRYAGRMSLKDEKTFRRMVESYSEKRWQSTRQKMIAVAGAPER